MLCIDACPCAAVLGLAHEAGMTLPSILCSRHPSIYERSRPSIEEVLPRQDEQTSFASNLALRRALVLQHT